MGTHWRGLARGLVAGATGTTALNAVTQLDMALRGRPATDTPQRVVARLAERGRITIPGGGRARGRRLAGLGPLSGIAVGVALGRAAGWLRSAGVRLPGPIGGPLLGAVAMAASDGPVALLGIGDPRRWTATDWLADVVPHLVYGVTTHAILAAAIPASESRAARPPVGLLLRAAAIGAATGSRSTAGVAALALTSTPADPGAVVSRLGSRTGTAVSGALAVGELLADKSPAAPARTAASGLVPRAALGISTAAGVARREGHDPTLAGLVGLGAALGTAVLGVQARAAAARRLGSDLPGAVTEDVLAATLGWWATRRR
jgi:uncharacterized membrane protein